VPVSVCFAFFEAVWHILMCNLAFFFLALATSTTVQPWFVSCKNNCLYCNVSCHAYSETDSL